MVITGGMVTSCNTPGEKAENAENKVIEANKDLNKANKKYLEDIEKYRKKTAENDSSIALSAKIAI